MLCPSKLTSFHFGLRSFLATSWLWSGNQRTSFLGNEKYMTDCHFVQDEPQSNSSTESSDWLGWVDSHITYHFFPTRRKGSMVFMYRKLSWVPQFSWNSQNFPAHKNSLVYSVFGSTSSDAIHSFLITQKDLNITFWTWLERMHLTVFLLFNPYYGFLGYFRTPHHGHLLKRGKKRLNQCTL